VKRRLGLIAMLHCCNKVPPRREESHVSSPLVGERNMNVTASFRY
jgi:hypothetical protein